jgi:hypothetical protein
VGASGFGWWVVSEGGNVGAGDRLLRAFVLSDVDLAHGEASVKEARQPHSRSQQEIGRCFRPNAERRRLTDAPAGAEASIAAFRV